MDAEAMHDEAMRTKYACTAKDTLAVLERVKKPDSASMLSGYSRFVARDGRRELRPSTWVWPMAGQSQSVTYASPNAP